MSAAPTLPAALSGQWVKLMHPDESCGLEAAHLKGHGALLLTPPGDVIRLCANLQTSYTRGTHLIQPPSLDLAEFCDQWQLLVWGSGSLFV